MKHRVRGRHFTFNGKLVGGLALIALADQLFYGQEPGVTLGIFALAWAAVLALVRPDVRRNRAARLALVAAAGFGLAMIDDPGPLDWCLFWTAILSASLLPRHRFRDALQWGARLFLNGLTGLGAPFRDFARVLRARDRTQGWSLSAVVATLAVPVIGGFVFSVLFAIANPVIANTLSAIQPPNLTSILGHLVFWSMVTLIVWPVLRPRSRARLAGGFVEGGLALPDAPLATLTLSLVTFNAIFAIQNVSDLVFLWSGAPLPDGVTLAEYAHRGAYPLIATALIAAGFVLIAARPGSAGAGSALVRRLILLWIAQNVLLVASSILRTLDYVAAYSLTSLRIAALAWMGLVAVGLILIVWRMLAGRSIGWLINNNAAAAALVLTACTVADLGDIAASYNVRKASTSDKLDLCYLRSIGSSALIPLIELERRAVGPTLPERVAWLRQDAMRWLERDQADWHSWTWRGARRLATARAMLAAQPGRTPRNVGDRNCWGHPDREPRLTAPSR